MSTIAPDLSWANHGADGGDLITAAATGGIAHPSGYPLYLIIARCFQLLPLGSLAYRTNLMSGIFAILTGLLVYSTVIKYLHTKIEHWMAAIAGLFAGMSIGVSPLFWSQAVITEVYTLHAFFVALIISLTVTVPKIKTDHYRSPPLDGLAFGLAASNHISAILLIPGAVIANLFDNRSQSKEISTSRMNLIGWQFFGAIAGISLYIMLPLRAIKNPIINWGNPVNLENFSWLVSGKIYQDYYLQATLINLWPKISASASILLGQIGLIGLILGCTGLVVFFTRSRLYLLTLWNALIFATMYLVYNSPDSFVYLIPTTISFSIWIGICVGYTINYIKIHTRVKWEIFVAILLINLIIGVLGNWQKVDASQDNRAQSFAQEVLSVAPRDAVIFADGDRAIFSLWYFHFALEKRPDLIVLSPDLLHYDWYQVSMDKAYPDLNLPSPSPWTSSVAAANPTREICYVRYDQGTEISCESGSGQ